MRRSGNINRTGHSLFSAENEDPRFDYATILPNRESRGTRGPVAVGRQKMGRPGSRWTSHGQAKRSCLPR